ncbi:MAG: HEAT repeat domain-containing protein [Gammaproteobacteria bacterium]
MKMLIFMLGFAAIQMCYPQLAQSAENRNLPAGEWALTWERQKLSVNAEAVPLARILLAIADKTGLVVFGVEHLQAATTTRFTEQSLNAGLHILLKGINYGLQEPSELNGWHYVLSVLSAASLPSAAQNSAVFEKEQATAVVPASAGYVPEQYRYLYGYAKNSDVTALCQAVYDGDATVQAIALQLLARQDPAEATRAAVAAAKNSDPGRRLNAVQALAEMDNTEAVNALGRALSDSDIAVRQSAVMGLHAQTSPQATSMLVQALQDQDESVRILAMNLLEEKGGEGMAGIGEALHSDNALLREQAQELLQRITATE